MLTNTCRKRLKGIAESFGRRGRANVARRKRSVLLRLEQLEAREVPAVISGFNQPQSGWLIPAPRTDVPAAGSSTNVIVRQAYGFNNIPAFSSNGQSVAADGRGQTIAIVDEFDDPNIANDLAVFDREFGLPAPPSFQKIGEYGVNALPKEAQPGTGYAFETALDVEWAHAMAPGANILLVEAGSDTSDLQTAAREAASYPGVSVVSISFADNTSAAAPGLLSAPGVTFVSGAGDHGVFDYPDGGPAALIVGGTQLSVQSNNSYQGEITWFNNHGSTGGGGYPDPSTGVPETPIPS